MRSLWLMFDVEERGLFLGYLDLRLFCFKKRCMFVEGLVRLGLRSTISSILEVNSMRSEVGEF